MVDSSNDGSSADDDPPIAEDPNAAAGVADETGARQEGTSASGTESSDSAGPSEPPPDETIPGVDEEFVTGDASATDESSGGDGGAEVIAIDGIAESEADSTDDGAPARSDAEPAADTTAASEPTDSPDGDPATAGSTPETGDGTDAPSAAAGAGGGIGVGARNEGSVPSSNGEFVGGAGPSEESVGMDVDVTALAGQAKPAIAERQALVAVAGAMAAGVSAAVVGVLLDMTTAEVKVVLAVGGLLLLVLGIFVLFRAMLSAAERNDEPAKTALTHPLFMFLFVILATATALFIGLLRQAW
jgi:hypothetical protein